MPPISRRGTDHRRSLFRYEMLEAELEEGDDEVANMQVEFEAQMVETKQQKEAALADIDKYVTVT